MSTNELPSAVLFCCTMNAVRSPMAEGIMKRYHGRRIYVESVGVRPGAEIDGFAVAVMEEIGIDLAKHQSRTFDELEDSSFDVVISLSPEAQHKAVDMVRWMACEVEFWNTLDPSIIEGTREVRLEAYRKIRDELIDKILTRFPVPHIQSG